MDQTFVILLLLLSAAASAQDVKEVKPGEEAVLPCEAGDVSITAVKWTRTDLKTDEYVFFYRDGYEYPTYQHPSFRGRVQLVHGDLKNGDVSLILKNVNINDAGTYECRVSGRLISSIRLEVKVVKEVKPGEEAVLLCEAGDVSNFTVKWTRPDLKSEEYVFFYKEGHEYPTYQLPSFRGRVQLVHDDLKNGDASLILKNVNINDAGTYECRADNDLISRIRLEVKEKENFMSKAENPENHSSSDGNPEGEIPENSKDRNLTGLIAGLITAVVLVCVVGLIVGLKYKKQREKKSEPADEAETEKQLV